MAHGRGPSGRGSARRCESRGRLRGRRAQQTSRPASPRRNRPSGEAVARAAPGRAAVSRGGLPVTFVLSPDNRRGSCSTAPQPGAAGITDHEPCRRRPGAPHHPPLRRRNAETSRTGTAGGWSARARTARSARRSASGFGMSRGPARPRTQRALGLPGESCAREVRRAAVSRHIRRTARVPSRTRAGSRPAFTATRRRSSRVAWHEARGRPVRRRRTTASAYVDGRGQR